MNKDLLRKMAFRLKEDITGEQVDENSKITISTLQKMPEFHHARVLMCYISRENEVQTEELINSMLNQGKKVAVPLITNTESCTMEASEISCLGDILHKGHFGICEPKPEHVNLLDPEKIDICIVPGLAFDLKRNRLGYGKGYFDRFLKKLRPDCVKIGLAFDMQIVDEIPTNENDVPMDLVITETRII